MKKFRFNTNINSTQILTVEGLIDVENNESVITDTLAAVLGENNFGHIIEDLGEDNPVSDEGILDESNSEENVESEPENEEEGEPENEEEGEPEAPQTPQITSDTNEILKGLLKKSLEELKEIAKDHDLPEEDYAKMNKASLAKYLIEKAFSQPE